MPTLEQIYHQINALPHKYIFYTKKEINYLPEILNENEFVMALTSGFMDNKTWLAVCTNSRVIFLDKGMFFGLNTVQMSHDRIQSIDSSYGILFGTIRMWDGATSMSISMVLKGSVDPFVRTVRHAIDEHRKSTMREAMGIPEGGFAQVTGSPPAAATAAPVDPASQLAKLADLVEKGYLTREEFEAQKAKLLG